MRQLKAAGARQVLGDVASGAKTARSQLRKALEQLDVGDVLMVTRLDRLARSTRDLLNTLATIAAKKAGFKSLGDTWADTTTADGRLMLTVLGGLAEFERELIRARTGEGRARAWRAVRRWAGSRSSPHTSSARPSSGAIEAKRCARSHGHTTSVTARFRDFRVNDISDAPSVSETHAFDAVAFSDALNAQLKRGHDRSAAPVPLVITGRGSRISTFLFKPESMTAWETIAAACAAFLSVYAADRQEKATFTSALYGKQVDVLAALTAKLNSFIKISDGSIRHLG